MIVYQYIRKNKIFATPSFELAYHRNQQGHVTSEVTTSSTTPEYYFEEACNTCHVPQQHYVSGAITSCGCATSSTEPEMVDEQKSVRKLTWHFRALHKRIYSVDEDS